MAAQPKRRRRLPPIAAPKTLALVLVAAAAACCFCAAVGADALFKATPTPAAVDADAQKEQQADPKQKYTALAKPQEADELLIGWMGETHRVAAGAEGAAAGGGGAASSGGATAATATTTAPPNNGTQPRRGVPRVLSWSPRIMHWPGFLSDAEADELVRRAEPRLHRSGVVDAKTGASKVDDVRSSSGQFFSRGEFPVVAAVEERLAMWTHLPVEFGEGMQVLR
jgi:hypothetical protein